jgi:hypothetical protein
MVTRPPWKNRIDPSDQRQRQDSGSAAQVEPLRTLSAASLQIMSMDSLSEAAALLLATADSGVTWQPQNSATKDHLLAVYALSPARVSLLVHLVLCLYLDTGRS